MRTLSQALVPEQANVMRGREGDTDHGYFTKQPNPAESRRRLFLAAAPDPGNRFFFIFVRGSWTNRFKMLEYVSKFVLDPDQDL